MDISKINAETASEAITKLHHERPSQLLRQQEVAMHKIAMGSETQALLRAVSGIRSAGMLEQFERIQKSFAMPQPGAIAAAQAAMKTAAYSSKLSNVLQPLQTLSSSYELAKISQGLKLNLDRTFPRIIRDDFMQESMRNNTIAKRDFEAFIVGGSLPKITDLADNLKLASFRATALAGINAYAPDAPITELLAQFNQNRLYQAELFDAAVSGFHDLESEPTEEEVTKLLHGLEKIASSVFANVKSLSELESQWQLWNTILAIIAILFTVYYGEVDDATPPLIIQNQYNIELDAAEAYSRLEDRKENIRFLNGRWYLREAPDGEAPEITILHSDQIVTVNRIEGQWAYVTVHSYAGEDEFEGWMHREGLQARTH